MRRENKVSNISRLFVGLPSFERNWKEIGLTDNDRRALELTLLDDPKAGVLVKATNGVRKVRHAIPGKGKSGGVRVFYYDFENLARVYFLAVIKKGDQENLSKEQRNELGAMIAAMKRGMNEQAI